MRTTAELAAFLAHEHLWLRVGFDAGKWWACLRNSRHLSFDGRGATPEEAVAAAKATYDRWRSAPPTLS